MNAQRDEEYAVRAVRRVWAFARDYGEWQTMRECFHSDATVHVLWYSGPVAGFLDHTIEASAARGGGESSKHWFGNSRVWINDDRALLETDAMVMLRTHVEGILFDSTLYIRLFDRLERRQGRWRILRMDAIYDKDRVDPVIPGSVPPGFFTGVDLTGPGSALGFMRWLLAKRGGQVAPETPLGGSKNEKKLRTDAETWLKGV